MRTLLLTLASAALLLSACGSGEDAAEPAGGGGGGGERIEVVLSDFALDPSTVTLDEAGTYTFVARNEGGVEHALKIDGEGFEAETPLLAPGEEAEVSVQIGDEGEYEMYCPVGNHREMGMDGAVVLGSDSGGGETTTGDETTTDDDDDDDDEDDDYRY